MLSKISISLQIRRDRDSARCDRKWKEHDCQFGGGFYDVSEGEILVDGVNVQEYTKKALCNKFSYVSQKVVLFSGTVFFNISYGYHGGQKPKLDEVKKAVEIAQSKDFVEKLEMSITAW